MNAGVTYSATLWYKTEYYGYTNVTNISILYGTAQNTTGLVNIVSESPATSAIYKPLTYTFTVPTSAIYYVAVKVSSNGNYGVNYLSWDDLSIIAPCDLNPMPVVLSTNAATICSGSELDLSATGADTYTWNTGAIGSTLTDYPIGTTNYQLYASSLLSGCTVTLSQLITVNPSPYVIAYPLDPFICVGGHTSLLASGASNYTWSAGTNPNASNVVVTPTVSSTYTVSGDNSYGCVDTKTVMVTVNPSPTITVTSDATANTICKGESTNLTGSGALTFNFSSPNTFISANPANVNPVATTIYTVTGTSALGCEGKTTYQLTVDACTGINSVSQTLNGLSVYPNPTSGVFTIGLNNTAAKTIVVTDLSGRTILSTTGTDANININLSAFANGVYYVKVQSENGVGVTKVIKN
jgi:hypothetical protein